MWQKCPLEDEEDINNKSHHDGDGVTFVTCDVTQAMLPDVVLVFIRAAAAFYLWTAFVSQPSLIPARIALLTYKTSVANHPTHLPPIVALHTGCGA